MRTKTAVIWMKGLFIYAIGVFIFCEAMRNSFSIMENLDSFSFAMAFFFISAASLVFYEESKEVQQK